MSLDMLKVNAGIRSRSQFSLRPLASIFFFFGGGGGGGALCISRRRSNLFPTFFVGARYQKVTVQLELNMQGARQSV